MEQYIYTCPECGSPSIKYESIGLVIANKDGVDRVKRDASCEDCDWKGLLSDTMHFATTEKVWTIESVADFLTQVMAKHTSGPMLQALEHVGIMPAPISKDGIYRKEGVSEEETEEGVEAHNALVRELRENVIRASLAGMISGGFTAASEAHHKYCDVMGIKPQGILSDD